jgi:hypothetical protein
VQALARIARIARLGSLRRPSVPSRNVDLTAEQDAFVDSVVRDALRVCGNGYRRTR